MSIGSLAVVISITPASLGVAEAVAVFSGLVVGITPAQAIAAAIIGRAVGTVMILILGPIFTFVILKHEPEKA
jgi:uncharacterized membrane protein YbhN (UPF0104 family)